jgi:hypothetical protein
MTKHPEWDQLKDEPHRAFKAFVAFLDLGPSRDYQRVSKTTHIEINTIYLYAARHHWRKRAHAFDSEQGSTLFEQLMDDRKIAARESGQLARIMKQKAIKFLLGDEDKNIKPFELWNLDPIAAARILPQWIKAISDLEIASKDTQTFDLEFAELREYLQDRLNALEEKEMSNGTPKIRS